MEYLTGIFLFIVGLLFLTVSADWLIQFSVKFAKFFKLSPLFIGIILVAFGTSMPELAVSILASLKGEDGIALGNVVGSNIANIALILGICGLLMPVAVGKKIFKFEVPIMLVSTLLLYFFSIDLLISRFEACLLLLMFVIFLVVAYKNAHDKEESSEIDNFEFKKIIKNVDSKVVISLLAAASLVGVVIGANLMVKGGVKLAYLFGVSPWVVGLTVFAVGTSLPELAASISAVVKKVPSISVGNIVGSNIFNILLVVGVAALIKPIQIEQTVPLFEMPALIIFTLCLYIVIKTTYKVTRMEGLALLSGYIFFIAAIIKR